MMEIFTSSFFSFLQTWVESQWNTRRLNFIFLSTFFTSAREMSFPTFLLSFSRIYCFKSCQHHSWDEIFKIKMIQKNSFCSVSLPAHVDDDKNKGKRRNIGKLEENEKSFPSLGWAHTNTGHTMKKAPAAAQLRAKLYVERKSYDLLSLVGKLFSFFGKFLIQSLNSHLATLTLIQSRSKFPFRLLC